MSNIAVNWVESHDSKAEREPSAGKVTRLVLPSILTYEIDRFLLAIDYLEDTIAARVMLLAGPRVGEVSGLLIRDLDPERCAVFVRQCKGGKDRWSPCDVSTIGMACAYAISQQFILDSLHISASTRTIQRLIEDAYLRVGITWGATCHTLRHACATWQLHKGISTEIVRENLGHEDIAKSTTNKGAYSLKIPVKTPVGVGY